MLFILSRFEKGRSNAHTHTRMCRMRWMKMKKQMSNLQVRASCFSETG